MDWKTDETLLALLKRGKETGSLTYDEVNAALPDSAPEIARCRALAAERGLDGAIDCDVLVCGDSAPAKRLRLSLVRR